MTPNNLNTTPKHMPSPLIECVPNFSEARRPEVVEAIQVAIQSVPTVRVLDRHSDLDHTAL